MAQCQWVAVVEDKETNLRELMNFRFNGFSTEENTKENLQKALPLHNVIAVSVNPYFFKNKDINKEV